MMRNLTERRFQCSRCTIWMELDMGSPSLGVRFFHRRFHRYNHHSAPWLEKFRNQLPGPWLGKFHRYIHHSAPWLGKFRNQRPDPWLGKLREIVGEIVNHSSNATSAWTNENPSFSSVKHKVARAFKCSHFTLPADVPMRRTKRCFTVEYA